MATDIQPPVGGNTDATTNGNIDATTGNDDTNTTTTDNEGRVDNERVEDGITNTDDRRIVNNNKRRRIIILLLIMIIIPVVCLSIYLVITMYMLDRGDVYIKNTDIQNVYVNSSIINTTAISLEAKYSLQVKFRTKGEIEVYPELGTYILSLNDISNQGFSILARFQFRKMSN